MSGTVLVLNGVAGAGKSSLARAIQDASDEPYLNAGIDHFLGLLPARYLEPPLWQEVMGLHDRAGATGERLVSAMHHAIAAVSRRELHVVADHVIVDPAWLAECAELFAPLSAYFVGVRCPPHVLRRRERTRSDRAATAGEVEKQLSVVHAGAAYDMEVDTSQASPAEAAAAVGEHVGRYPPRAFRLLLLFERAPAFVRRLLAEPSVERWPAFLDRAEATARGMPENEQVELLNAHPRIGAAPGSVSAMSYREQGYDRDPERAELRARLEKLNAAYESRFGFRFVIHVAGRPRQAVADIIERSLTADREAEKQRALGDVVAIARDRLSRLASDEEAA